MGRPRPRSRSNSPPAYPHDSSLSTPLTERDLQRQRVTAEFGNTGQPGYLRGAFGSFVNQIVDPRRLLHQHFLLVLVCSFVPGPYFFDMIFAAYKGPIKDAMGINNSQFGLFFALSTVTGVACGPFGALIAKVGRTRWVVISGFVCMLGALFTVLGFQWELYLVMLAARFFFWLSLYGILLAQS